MVRHPGADDSEWPSPLLGWKGQGEKVRLPECSTSLDVGEGVINMPTSLLPADLPPVPAIDRTLQKPMTVVHTDPPPGCRAE